MHTICQQTTSSARAVCFHETRPLVLSAHENGIIRLVNYNIGSLQLQLSKSPEEITALALHPTQPFFACGCSSGLIYCFNYSSNRLLFSFSGNLDIITSLDFHHEQPLLVSASKDGTTRLFNWQSRLCLSILDSEVDQALCAKFSPSSNYIATGFESGHCYLWDFTSLLQFPNSSKSLFNSQDHDGCRIWGSLAHTSPIVSIAWQDNKFVSFSANGNLKFWIIHNGVQSSGSVDLNRSLISGAFHPNSSLFASISSKGQLHMIDGNGRSIHDFQLSTKPTCFAMHRSFAVTAIGHSTGVLVIKMWPERPVFDTIGDFTLIAHKNQLSSKMGSIKLRNPKANHVCLSLTKESAVVSYSGFVFDLVNLKTKESQTFAGVSAVFVNRTVFAALSIHRNKISVFENGKIHKIPLQQTGHRLFPAQSGQVFISTHETLFLFDTIRHKFIGQLNIGQVKGISSDDQKTHFCGYTSTSVFSFTNQLTELNIHREEAKIKSAKFLGNIVLFTTHFHLKYFLFDVCGIISSLPKIVYLSHCTSDCISFITRDHTFYHKKFKQSDLEFIYNLITGSPVRGIPQPVGNFLFDLARQKKRYNVAMVIAPDWETRFEMSLGAQNIDAAEEAARALDKPIYWKQLGEIAMNFGRFTLAEESYRRGNDLESLKFLYLLQGDQQSLEALPRTIETALWLNDHDFLAQQISRDCDDSLKPSFGRCFKGDWPIQYQSQQYAVQQQQPQEEDSDIFDVDLTSWEPGDNTSQSIDVDSAVVPISGQSMESEWRNSLNVFDLICAGDFSSALDLLHHQIAAVNFEGFKELFVQLYIQTHPVYETSFGFVKIALCSRFHSLLIPNFDLSHQIRAVTHQVSALFLQAKVRDCLNLVHSFFRLISIFCVTTEEEEKDFKSLIPVMGNLGILCNFELGRQLESNKQRQLELALLMTHCPISDSRIARIPLMISIQLSQQLKMKKTVIKLCDKYLRMDGLDTCPPTSVERIKKCRAAAAKFSSDSPEHEFEFNSNLVGSICPGSLKAIEHGMNSSVCPLCCTKYRKIMKGTLCVVCAISKVGGDCEGFSLRRK